MSGRSIRIFLVDGSPSGVRTAEIGLSTIKAIAIPRASLQSVTNREEIRKTGIYVLIGQDSKISGRKRIYIGEGDEILQRLNVHNKDQEKDFWDECVAFVSKDQNLTKAHVRFLESKLVERVRNTNRASVENNTCPTGGSRLPEADEVEMEEFLSQVKLLLGTLGYDILDSKLDSGVFSGQEVVKPDNQNVNDSDYKLRLTFSGNSFESTCVMDSDSGQFIVKKDSKARKEATQSMQDAYKKIREDLLESGTQIERFKVQN